MSRSAADATRFTATGPYASSKPGTTASSTAPYKIPGFLSNSSPGRKPQGQGQGDSSGTGREESPREKVERLRAQARASRIAQSTSRVDRFIDVGRRYANRAHKVMVYSLITASGVCGALTIYSVISLTLYNRRQRTLWLDRELEKLQSARSAYTLGTATTEQMDLLKNEKVGEIIKQKKAEEKEQRPWNRAKRYLFGGLKTEENAPTSAAAIEAAHEVSPSLPESSSAEFQTAGNPNNSAVLNMVPTESEFTKTVGPENAAVGQSPSQVGQLDSMAENAETTAKQSARSWKSWFFGR